MALGDKAREWRVHRHFPDTETKRCLQNAAVPRRFERSWHRGWWRPDWLAGHVRFELRNVVANYPFEKSRRFGGIQPNSGPGDHSREWSPGPEFGWIPPNL